MVSRFLSLRTVGFLGFLVAGGSWNQGAWAQSVKDSVSKDALVFAADLAYGTTFRRQITFSLPRSSRYPVSSVSAVIVDDPKGYFRVTRQLSPVIRPGEQSSITVEFGEGIFKDRSEASQPSPSTTTQYLVPLEKEKALQGAVFRATLLVQGIEQTTGQGVTLLRVNLTGQHERQVVTCRGADAVAEHFVDSLKLFRTNNPEPVAVVACINPTGEALQLTGVNWKCDQPGISTVRWRSVVDGSVGTLFIQPVFEQPLTAKQTYMCSFHVQTNGPMPLYTSPLRDFTIRIRPLE